MGANIQFKKGYLLGLIFFIGFSFLLVSETLCQSSYVQMLDPLKQENFFDVQKKFNDYWKGKIPKKGGGWKQFKRWEWFWEPRLYPDGKFPDMVHLRQDWNNYLEKNPKKDNRLLTTSSWKFLGPSSMPSTLPNLVSAGMGRINCVGFDKTNPQIIWAGSAYGGVWKSTNAGLTWFTFPFTNFLSIGVSDIAVSPSNPNVVYVATGDADGSLSGSACYSIGVIKTTDGGGTWNQTAFQYQIPDNVIINKILVDPQNPDLVFVASTKGMYKTTDGGITWNQFLNFYCKDMEFKANNADTIYGTVIGNSTQGGFVYGVIKYSVSSSSWTPTTLAFSTNDVIRMQISVTPANPNLIYALATKSDLGLHSITRTTDGGKNWYYMIIGSDSTNLLSPNHDAKNTQGALSQGQYDLCIAASPTDTNTVFVGGVNIWKSVRTTNGGWGWNLAGEWTGQYSIPYVHADQHSLKFFPGTNNLFSTNDGGIKRTSNNGLSWEDISSGLGVTQFYTISSSAVQPDLMFGGTQDNGTYKLLKGEWQQVLGGDGMVTLVDPQSINTIYGSLYYGDFKKSVDGGVTWAHMLDSTNTGEKGGWVTPLIIDPTNPQTLYAGYINLFKSTNRGGGWNKISNFDTLTQITSIAVAPSDPNIIYVAKYGGAWKTTNGGQSWTQVLFGGTITGLVVDPKNAKRIWCTVSGYNDSAKVYFFDGNQLKNLHGSLPNVPVNCIVYQKNNPDGIDGLYIGTDVGVFYRDSRMDDWQLYSDGLPNVVISQLEINYSSKKIHAATFGRGLWESDIVQCLGALPVIQVDGKADICEGDSVKLEVASTYLSYKWSTGDTTNFTWAKNDGKYTVSITDASNCIYTSNPITIVTHTVPAVTISVTSDTVICKGDSVVLTANPRFGISKYEWSNGANGRVISVGDSGTYTVTCTTIDSCNRTSDPITIIVKELPAKPTITKQGNLLVSSDAISYQWYLNGAAIKNATGKTLILVQSGKYTVKITGSNGCTNVSDPYDFINSVDNQETDGVNVAIHPNPNSGIFNIDISSARPENIKIEVVDMSGKTIYEKNNISLMNNYKTQVDMHEQSAGVYFVKISTGTIQILRKIVKE